MADERALPDDLFEGLSGDEERAARRALIRALLDDGCPIEDVRRAIAERRLALLPMERVFAKELRHTVDEVIADSRLDERFMRRNFLALGLSYPEPAEPSYSDDEAAAIRLLRPLLDAGLPEDRMLELSRVIGRATQQIAAAMLEELLRSFLRDEDTERDLGLRLAELTNRFLPSVGPLVTTPLRFHLREAVRHEVVGRTEELAGELARGHEIAVCFADLVSFTALGERGGTRRVGAIVERFEDVALASARRPVRLVKLVGDAAMLVSRDAGALVDAASTLATAVAADDSLPELRVGVAAGPALNRGGDWYGPPVNLASRVCDGADPGEVVATEPVVRATADRFEWAELGARRLKGIEDEVGLWALC